MALSRAFALLWNALASPPVLSVTHRDALTGDIDIEAMIRLVPPKHLIKGAFLAKYAAAAGPELDKLQTTLVAPPRGGRYLPFTDYPFVDYLRLSDVAARRKYKHASPREAHRLLARSVYQTFSETTLGKVVGTFATGPAPVMLKYEDVYNRMLVGARVTVRQRGDHHVEAEFINYYSTVEAIVGVFEGMVLAHHGTPCIAVTVGDQGKPRGHYVAKITWQGALPSAPRLGRVGTATSHPRRWTGPAERTKGGRRREGRARVGWRRCGWAARGVRSRRSRGVPRQSFNETLTCTERILSFTLMVVGRPFSVVKVLLHVLVPTVHVARLPLHPADSKTISSTSGGGA